MKLKNWSFWERQELKGNWDAVIVGAGFAGLSTAYHLKKSYPNKNILVLERDIVGEGASTKNAGFACYGTMGEIIADIDLMGKEASLQLVKDRIAGLAYLREIIPDQEMDYRNLGGVELYTQEEFTDWERSMDFYQECNQFFLEHSVHAELFKPREVKGKAFIGAFYSPLESQLNPVKALRYLKSLCLDIGVEILYGVEVESIEKSQKWDLFSKKGKWSSSNLIFCTNAFGVPGFDLDLKPARNQVLITKAFDHGLKPGNYHLREGYIYLRTVGDRILIGGARHLAQEEEETSELGETEMIQRYLREFLDLEMGFAGRYEVDQTWSGIIATGSSKQPLLIELKENLWYCGRFGGMGVALGVITGKKMATKLKLD